MTIQFSRSTKFMCAGIALSLGWFVLESCECDETKEDKFPGFWITCIGNKPTMMNYSGDSPNIVTSDPAGSFNPSQWDCSTPGSPPQPKPGAPAFKTGSPSGPGGYARKSHATTPATAAYLPQLLRDLPFVPHVPPPTSPTCDSTFPDMFQTVHTNALVTRITTCPFKITATIPVVTRPLQAVLTPDGSTLLVTSFDNAVNFIDVGSNKVVYTLMTDLSFNPDGLAISPDGTRAYVTSFNTNGGIAVIDLTARKILSTIPTIAYPQGVAITPDGSQLWVTSPLGASVGIFDTLTSTQVTGLNISETTDVAFNSTGTRAYITTSSTVPGSVVAVDTGTYQIIKSYTTDSGPTNASMSYGDQFLVVNNNLGGSVSVIDFLKDVVVTTKVGANSSPAGIAFVH